MNRACSTYGEKGKYILLEGEGPPNGKRPLYRPRRRWEDNIRMNLVDRI
jgi:hypothetical protein